MPQKGTRPHAELTPAEIEKARQVIGNLPWQNAPQDGEQNVGVAFDHLHDEELMYVFFQQPDNNVKWVSFRLVYEDSSADTDDLPDCEAGDIAGDCTQMQDRSNWDPDQHESAS